MTNLDIPRSTSRTAAPRALAPLDAIDPSVACVIPFTDGGSKREENFLITKNYWSKSFEVFSSDGFSIGDARNRAQKTDALYGTATCNNGENGDTATYCDKDRDGRNGNEIFASTSQQSTQVGWAKPGTRLEAYCKEKGTNIDSYIYNSQKQSSWWVQVNYEGKNYIPFAWLNLDGGDDINDLPTC